MLAPFFTVVIATHKRPVLLRRAITSILNQTYQNFKIIIISDSKDFDTYSTASELLRISDVFIQREGIPGPSESRNLGIQCATGTHVIFLDDDDAFDNTFFSDLVNSSKFTVLDKLFYVNCKVIDLGLTKSTTLINTSTPDKGTIL